jgi:hypothetical protein
MNKICPIASAMLWHDEDRDSNPGGLCDGAGQTDYRERRNSVKVFDHFENWDHCTNKCSVSLQAVDGRGTILWANDTELTFIGYAPEEYVGRFIGDFHVDEDVLKDIFEHLPRDETLIAYPA